MVKSLVHIVLQASAMVEVESDPDTQELMVRVRAEKVSVYPLSMEVGTASQSMGEGGPELLQKVCLSALVNHLYLRAGNPTEGKTKIEQVGQIDDKGNLKLN